jgi:hypothetical protein
LWGSVSNFGACSQRRARESSRRNKENLRELRRLITSADSILRGEGYFVALFRLLRYLFVGSILWIIAWAASFFESTVGIAVGLVALGAYYYGLRWLYNITRPAKPESVNPSGKLLMLHSAKYGAGNIVVDVTAILAERLADGSLEVYAGNQLGGDPCPGRRKELVVDYSYAGQRHARHVPEGEILSLP